MARQDEPALLDGHVEPKMSGLQWEFLREISSPGFPYWDGLGWWQQEGASQGRGGADWGTVLGLGLTVCPLSFPAHLCPPDCNQMASE